MVAGWFFVVRAKTKLVENAYVTMTVWSIVRFWFFLLIFCDLLFWWDFFLTVKTTRKPRCCGKRTFYLFLGVNVVFQFMRISVIGLVLIVLQSFIYTAVDEEL